MSKQATQTTPTAPDTAASLPPKIQASWVRKNNNASNCWSEFLVHLPAGVWVQQLHDHADHLWSHVFFAHAIRQLDMLTLVSHDRTRITSTRVLEATPRRVVIDVKAAQRNEAVLPMSALRRDDVHEAIVTGPSFAIRRIADGEIVRRELPTLERVNREFDLLYPVRPVRAA